MLLIVFADGFRKDRLLLKVCIESLVVVVSLSLSSELFRQSESSLLG